ncbi:hypothetical protein BRD17_04715 [Halobacteriales archaeon SW_7_68_16]|nr:MAG: hypothetical protein BRD17_04715 [Halobacteriales archaeon SW_7_68_16]
MSARPTVAATRRLFVAMLREEWRLHARLFGGIRFALFPAFVALAGAGAVWALSLPVVGTSPDAVAAGAFALVFAFGLQTGTVALAGRDAMANLLGDRTFLVYSARTLPLGVRHVLSVFFVKEVVYYAGLFLLPVALAFAPAVLVGPFAPLAVPVLWLALVATFALGLAATVFAIAATTRGRAGRALLLGVAVVLGLAGVVTDPVVVTPYALFAAPSPVAAAGTVGLPLVLLAVGFALYDTEYERPARSSGPTFGTWRRRLRDDDGLVTKSLLDVARSSGGLWKVPFSAGLLFVVAVFLVDLAGRVTQVPPSVGVSFGSILGLTAFSSYNWLTQFDSPRSYLAHPVSVADVFRAKFRAFVLLGVPTALAFHVVAVVQFGAAPLPAVLGAALLVGLLLYFFGLTTFVAGFDPNDFLFDVVLFAGFTVAVVVAPTSTGTRATTTATGQSESLNDDLVARDAAHGPFGKKEEPPALCRLDPVEKVVGVAVDPFVAGVEPAGHPQRPRPAVGPGDGLAGQVLHPPGDQKRLPVVGRGRLGGSLGRRLVARPGHVVGPERAFALVQSALDLGERDDLVFESLDLERVVVRVYGDAPGNPATTEKRERTTGEAGGHARRSRRADPPEQRPAARHGPGSRSRGSFIVGHSGRVKLILASRDRVHRPGSTARPGASSKGVSHGGPSAYR